ncbi:hypothetical protein [Telmatospirillum sp. J64-1]|uniref:hypothetical protein n=1 Tax=Telmatospirillum sp. J64-1 TaxID=2502183 RepID=UPI00115DC63D|nr:hypothetical protein [Telmatospirillum sp. J64-1]
MIKRLPKHLRTEHWYNDWQHAVFLIIFDHLSRALRDNQTAMAERQLDKLTLYIFVHFLCEEEGMSFSLDRSLIAAQTVEQHQAVHMKILDYWHEAIQRPYKEGLLPYREIAERIEEFYGRILDHIEHTDQASYGVKSDRDPASIRSEVAHIARCGLPLSPNMAGAARVVEQASAETFSLLDLSSLPSKAVNPLRVLTLVKQTDGADLVSLRRRFIVNLSRIQSLPRAAQAA